ncbi:MAG: long-chain fatty acid--CoA ligase [Nitrospirota bacterium]
METSDKTLLDLLYNAAIQHSRRTALIFDGKKLKYKEILTLIERFSSVILTLGITSGDRVALLLRNSSDYIISYFGILRIGAIAVPLNTMLTGEEVSYIIRDCGAKLVITSSDLSGIVSGIKDIRVMDIAEILRRRAGMPSSIPSPLADDTAVIIYTSGTTGFPKGAMLTHSNLISNVIACREAIEVTDKDRMLLFLPMFHSFTFTVCVLVPLSVGARIIILPSVRPFSQLIKALLLERITIFVAVPAIYNILLKRRIPWILLKFFNLRLCVSGAAPLSEDILRRFEERFQIPLIEGYGLSEASPVVSVNPLKGVRKAGSVGLPLPGVSVRIVSDDGTELPAGEVGEIVVSGPNVMRGYGGNPQETEKTLRNGWLFTGDLGRIDNDGYLYIVDRKKDMIIVNGMNVYPREIEEVLLRHQKVSEVAVIGIPDKDTGEIPKAFVVLKDGQISTPKEIRDYCREHLAIFKVPKQVEFRDSLPKNPTGKILKRELKKG